MKYSISHYSKIAQVLNTMLVYCIAFITTFYIYEKHVPTPIWFLGIPIIIISFTLIQTFCFNPILYILLHGIFWIPAFIINFSYIEYQNLFLLLLFIESIKAFHSWKKNSPKEYNEIPWPIFACISIICIIGSANKMHDFAKLIFYLGLLALLLHFVRLFITGIGKLLTRTSNATSVPLKKILITDAMFFILFLFITFLLMACTQLFNADPLTGAVTDIFSGLLYIVFYIGTLVSALFNTEQRANTLSSVAGRPPKSAEELTEFGNVVYFLLKIILLILFIYIMYRIISSLAKLFSSRYLQEGDTVISTTEVKDIEQTPQKKSKFVQRIIEFFKNDYASKIRRGYKLKIKSYKPSFYEKQNTSTELAEKVEELYEEDIYELTQVYQKVRYSQEEITFEDVQKGGLL